ncbi:MAG: nicotinate-nucleotide adenylyltransferase [Planctomycetia bacterium]|nr:nicotinate-nucleotide adenylyltransferase [Planctomycetia bacterium]
MRIGIFGGSFNPVHVGHLIAAECCREQGRLDRVVFVPAAIPPHKQGHQLADASHRVAMLNLAVGGHGAFAVSTVEIDRGGVSYTIDTLAALATEHPHDELVLILGPDALAQLPTWREPRTIAGQYELLAVERETLDDLGTLAGDAGLADLLGRERLEKIIAARVRMPAVGIRASDLRAAVAAGRSIRYRTPRAVEAYIPTHGLYRDA